MNPAQQPTEDLCSRFDAADFDPAQLTSSEMDSLMPWTSLRDDLRAIPVQKAELSASIMGAVQNLAAGSQPQPSQPQPQPQPQPTAVAVESHALSVRPARYEQRARIATLVSVLTLASCVILLSVLPRLSVSPLRSLTAVNMNSLAEELSKCDVVVVRVPQTSSPGLDLEGLVDLGRGSQLTSDRGMPLRELDQAGEEMFADLAEFDRVTNPEFIGDMTREELMAKVLESVETPSLAEEHFGEMLVLFPSDLLEDIRMEARQGTLVAEDGQPPVAPSAVQHADRTTVEPPPRRKVFVVLKTPAEQASDVVPDVSRLPGTGPQDALWRYTGV
ncbi:MAG: hypothetical protein NXI04_18985 [Planctomycetaceae bacterium]|nr:hypothetical protein [Planctomycetaceae bacterium]